MSFRVFQFVQAKRRTSACLHNFLGRKELEDLTAKDLVISFLGQAIYVQFVDVDFEDCRAADQPRSSQGHFLCSTPYRARLPLTELLWQLQAAARHKHWRDQSLGGRGGLCCGCCSEEARLHEFVFPAMCNKCYVLVGTEVLFLISDLPQELH